METSDGSTLSQGNLPDAVLDLERAITLMRQTNSKGEMDLWLGALADALLDKGDIPSTTKQLEEGFRVNAETGDKRVGSYLHTTRSRLLLAQGELDESRREAELAIKACLDINDEGGAHERGLLLARLDLAQNHPQTAVAGLRKALSDSKTQQEERPVKSKQRASHRGTTEGAFRRVKTRSC